MTPAEVTQRVCRELYQRMPVSVAVIDPGMSIVETNRAFIQTFGDWTGRQCYEGFRRRKRPCALCGAAAAFSDGTPFTARKIGTDRQGNLIQYVLHLFPLADDAGRVTHVIEMATEIETPEVLQDRYQILFDNTPCFVAIIDRNFRVLQANQKFRDTFGDPSGRFCHQLYKQRPDVCDNCPAMGVFQSGEERQSRQVGVDIHGHETHYMVNATPLTRAPGGAVDTVMEIAIDVSRIVELETQLKQTFELQQTVIRSSMDGLIVTDENEKILLFNQAAENLLGLSAGDMIGHEVAFKSVIPAAFYEMLKRDVPGGCQILETSIRTSGGESIPVRVSGSVLGSGGRRMGYAAFLQDLRPIKKLEEEKLTAERLAAVGQTVSGLAHGIKNIITGLEGGLYVMETGLRKSEVNMIGKGMQMLDGNIRRISHFVKEFLNFARGKAPEVSLCDPVEPAREVVALYEDAAARVGIRIAASLQNGVAPAPIDCEGIHACLSNLVSNAIDACQMSDKKKKRITVRAFEENGAIGYEVADNGIGMDYEVKKKVFTSFFSTKGSHEGTGIGLLITRKIIQEHGGSVQFETRIGRGATFRIELPRARLPALTPAEPANSGNQAAELPDAQQVAKGV